MLASLAQQDFSAGMWRAVARHLIPPNGAYDLVNCLLDEDGSPYRRGGSEYLSTSAFGTGLRLVWDGFLTPGARTFIANSADFGVLDGSEGPVNLGLGGLSQPRRAVEIGGILFVGGGTLWGGSRKTATYATGTVAVTQGSATVTGTGSAWLANVDSGMLFQRTGDNIVYPVASVGSDTSITLRDPYRGATGSGLGYALHHIFTAAPVYRTGVFYAVGGSRLWSFEGHRAYFSGPDDPHFWESTDFHEFTEETLGGDGIGDRLLVFTTSGVQMVSNLAYDLTDDFGNVQHRNEKVGEQILWSHEGIAQWRQAIVAPCADHVWLMDGISQPLELTKSISGLYRSYVAAGYKTGVGAVVRSHYFLPILDASNVPVDCLVCRLDRPTATPLGTVWPWMRWQDFSAKVAGLAVRTGGSASSRNPVLLGASTESSSRVLKMNSCFGPDVGQKNEPDGSTHTWEVVTRDYATQDGISSATVRRMVARYELKDAASDDPTIPAYYSTGEAVTATPQWGEVDWGEFDWTGSGEAEWVQMAGAAPEDTGDTPFDWHANVKARFIRYRLRSTSPTTKLVLRTVESLVRPTAKQR